MQGKSRPDQQRASLHEKRAQRITFPEGHALSRPDVWAALQAWTLAALAYTWTTQPYEKSRT